MKRLSSVLGRVMVSIVSVMLVTIMMPEHSKIFANTSLDTNVDKEFYTISTAKELYDIRTTDSAVYMLLNDIDLTNEHWEPIRVFEGVLDGNGYTIRGLNIDSNSLKVGMIIENKGEIKNLVLSEPKIRATNDRTQAVGALVAENIGIISHVKVSGSDSTSIYSTSGYTGSLVGKNYGQVVNCHSNINVTGEMVGGLIGLIESKDGSKGSIVESSALGLVTTDTRVVGGLVGRSSQGSISNSFAKVEMNISAKNDDIDVGGIAGQNTGRVYNCYAVVEINKNSSKKISGVARASNEYSVQNSFYNADLLKVTHKESRGSSLSTDDMKLREHYIVAGWDFVNTWYMKEGEDHPMLRRANPQAEDDERIPGDINPPEDKEESTPEEDTGGVEDSEGKEEGTPEEDAEDIEDSEGKEEGAPEEDAEDIEDSEGKEEGTAEEDVGDIEDSEGKEEGTTEEDTGDIEKPVDKEEEDAEIDIPRDEEGIEKPNTDDRDDFYRPSAEDDYKYSSGRYKEDVINIVKVEKDLPINQEAPIIKLLKNMLSKWVSKTINLSKGLFTRQSTYVRNVTYRGLFT